MTQLGIFHNNMFNHFNLGCDLMEPFRVLVDRKVKSRLPIEFGIDEKHAMWTIIQDKVLIDGTTQSVANAIKIYTRSVIEAINDGDPFQIKFYSDIFDDGYYIDI